MTQRQKIVTGLMGLAALAFSLPALADENPSEKRNGGGAKDASYGYVFPDDPLDAGGFDPNDVQIRVLPKPKRSTLIRPRVQFISEMLKSVESI